MTVPVVPEAERVMLLIEAELTVCVIVLELPEKLPVPSEYVAVMVCVPLPRVEVVHVAWPVEASTACAEQPGMEVPVTLSANATEPVSDVLPAVNPMVAVSVTASLTLEGLGDPLRTSVVVSALTVCCKTGVPVLLGL